MGSDLIGRWIIALPRICLLFLVASISAIPVYAANDCPWMNEATASGLLGGTAVGMFQAATTEKAAVCTFTQR